MSNYARIIIVKNGNAFDVSDMLIRATWRGRRGASARSLDVEFLDDDGFRHERTGLNVEQGHQCIFYWNEKELFRGIFMSQSQSNGKTLTAKAYDNGIYLANNKDTFNYTDTTASAIFTDACTRFGLPTGQVADTMYRIPELPKPKTTAWDVIADALSLTFRATGIRFYVMCAKDSLSLIQRNQNIYQWVIETGSNLESYQRTLSIEKIKTRIKLLSKEGDVVAEAADSPLESKIGVFQDVVQISDEMNAGQLNELANTTLQENNKATQTLTVSSPGLADVITGVGVFISIKPLGVSRTYYVEEDTHTFQGRQHSMQLKLAEALDV